jgi:MFS family permease
MLLIAGATNGGADSLLAGSVSMRLGEENGNVGAALTGLINGIATLGAVIEGPMFGWIADHWGWGYMFAGVILVSFAGSCLIFRAVILERKRGRVAKMSDALDEDKVPLV